MTVSVLTPSTTSSTQLSKLGNGEYTASSVSADPTDANKLGLIKEADGNYGTTSATAVAATGTPAAATSGTAAAQSSSSVLAALTSLTLGG